MEGYAGLAFTTMLTALMMIAGVTAEVPLGYCKGNGTDRRESSGANWDIRSQRTDLDRARRRICGSLIWNRETNSRYQEKKATKKKPYGSASKKARGKRLETQPECALELFAPKLIHESRNCSHLYSLPRVLPEENVTHAARRRGENCELPTHRYSQ